MEDVMAKCNFQFPISINSEISDLSNEAGVKPITREDATISVTQEEKKEIGVFF
jgi:hypothetical protein